MVKQTRLGVALYVYCLSCLFQVLLELQKEYNFNFTCRMSEFSLPSGITGEVRYSRKKGMPCVQKIVQVTATAICTVMITDGRAMCICFMMCCSCGFNIMLTCILQTLFTFKREM